MLNQVRNDRSKKRWESQEAKLIEDGYPESKVTYELIKKFHDNNEYTIELKTAYHIQMEMIQVEAILPWLQRRSWVLVKSNEDSGPFISNDNPVCLSWIDPDKIPPLYRNSPGFGMKSTEVYFPVSKSLALVGRFNKKDSTIEGSVDLISALNTKILSQTYKQVYSPKIGFHFYSEDGRILDGNQILRVIGA